ncbi:hypothetical protein [Halorientalis pallida]|uniref:Uncharacterized protein n=1 Tax=Halorientalis pallida TaxID=2479928 RepID=A0A498L575_9EURY|nr:hypothetical protein [Halorientalis pallida]RXK51814.1 hypothetical protein EAF64_04055 [Halorientalis pallida]
MSRSCSLLVCGLVLVLAVLVAGCSAPVERPTDGTNVSVSVTNENATTQEVRIAVVAGDFDAVELTYRNGSTRRLTVPNVSAIPSGALADVSDFRILGPDVQHTAYRLAPGSGRSASYTVDGPATVVYTYWPRGAERVTDYGAVGCERGATLDARIVVGASGSDSATVTCRSG